MYIPKKVYTLDTLYIPKGNSVNGRKVCKTW
jgi:hypothetical protein